MPLPDSTIFEMEKRGEFPHRFNLSPRCVVWDLAKSKLGSRIAEMHILKVAPRLHQLPT
ncbi:MAG: helix-turn-helix transcriptional regulator [Sphingorhabdus sp.]